MKAFSSFFLFLLISTLAWSQDTIYLKNGTTIPAIILDTSGQEIRYKKYMIPEPIPIYTLFVSDVSMIKFKNGTIVDFASRNTIQLLGGAVQDVKMKLSVGFSESYFKRNEDDNLLLFWRARNKNEGLHIGGNPYIFSCNFKFSGALGGTQRNWFGSAANINFSKDKAIYASNFYNGENDINLKFSSFDIFFFYGHSINYKKNLIVILETGISGGNLSGTIKLKDIDYKISGTSNSGLHISVGMDWMISKNLNTFFRVGRKSMTSKVWFNDSNDPNDAFTLWVNPPSNWDVVSMGWKGYYASLGLVYCFNFKMK